MFLAMACDYRLASNAFHMWCLPEIALGLPIPTEGLAMFKAKLTPSVLQETVIGKRWKGQELVDSGIAHELVDADKLVERAVTLGEEKAPAAAQGVWGTIKESMYVDVAEHLARRRMIPYPDVEDRAFQFRMERMGKCPERGTVNGKE
jgi:enoyl-CoA hydratase/carnithine racemase